VEGRRKKGKRRRLIPQMTFLHDAPAQRSKGQRPRSQSHVTYTSKIFSVVRGQVNYTHLVVDMTTTPNERERKQLPRHRRLHSNYRSRIMRSMKSYASIAITYGFVMKQIYSTLGPGHVTQICVRKSKVKVAGYSTYS